MRLSLDLGLGSTATLNADGASSFAPSAAPGGYRWDFVYQDGARVTLANEPIVALVRNA